MKVDSKKLTYFCGFLGSAIILLGSLATAMLCQGNTVASFASYLMLPHVIRSTHGHTLHAHRLARCHIHLSPILEWSVFFTVIAWFVLMSIYFMVKRPVRVEK